jgi:hypothetical protein
MMAMVTMIITWLALTASYAIATTFVVTTLTMAAMIITWLALTASYAAVVTDAVVTPMASFTVTASIVTHLNRATCTIVDLVSASHCWSVCACECAAAHALNSPCCHASVCRTHAHTAMAAAVSFAGASGKQCESAGNNCHRGTN